MKKLTKKEAIELLELPAKVFENYFQEAEELVCLPREGGRGRYCFDKAILEEWQKGYRWRTVSLDKNDYARCLDFALAMHFREYVTSDFGTGRQREFGQKITNWVKGQLGELAVQKFLKANFGVTVELDFDIHDTIVPQDIVRILDGDTLRDPRVGIGIKSSKPKAAYLILGENEITIPERRSDVYIFCRPDIPDDHLLRITSKAITDIVKEEQHFSSYKDKVLDFQNISCEVVGFCEYTELERVTGIRGQEFDGIRYVKKSGRLHKSPDEWKKLVARI